MTDEELRVVKAVLLWQAICDDPLGNITEDDINTADMFHSSLLQRLLEGQPPLPLPPPKAFSYPWYSLIERGEGWCDAMVWQDTKMVINQGLWDIVKREDQHEVYLVQWPLTKLLCRIRHDLEREAQRMVCCWHIQVVSSPEPL